jgi:hypothetical protein
VQDFASTYAKLERAEEHMADLRRRLVAHMNRPDVVVGHVEYRPDKPTEQNMLTHVTIQGLPHSVQTIAGDVAHNLRSALDHAAWQLVIANGGTPVEPAPGQPATQFPIYLERPRRLEVAGGISDEALDIVREAQPYACPDTWRGGLLAALRHINNTDKHREAVRGRKGLTGWVTWSSTDRSEPWDSKIELGNADENGVEIHFSEPDDPGGGGGKARHWVEIEMSPDGEYEALCPALDNISWVVRELVEGLVATTNAQPPPDPRAGGRQVSTG